MKIKLYFVSLLSLFFVSCDNSLNINAPWKEVMVVYGLLNPTDQVQYIKINKAYLSTTDAIESAKISDSLFFDSLDVKLMEYLPTNQLKDSFKLTRELGISKDTGIFANDLNILYKHSAPIDARNTYNIKITNPSTGLVVTGRTIIVGAPVAILSVPRNKLDTLTFLKGKPVPVRFKAGNNAKFYDLLIRFHYQEIDINDTTKVTSHFADWIPFKGLEVTSPNSEISTNFFGEFFYDFVGGAIAVNPNVKRRAVAVDFMYYGGSDEMKIYMSVNKPSIGIVQKKPEYTNIGNGLGLFSSRHIHRISQVPLSVETHSALRLSESTRNLNFIVP